MAPRRCAMIARLRLGAITLIRVGTLTDSAAILISSAAGAFPGRGKPIDRGSATYPHFRKLALVRVERDEDLVGQLVGEVLPEHVEVLCLDVEHVVAGPLALVDLVQRVHQRLGGQLHRCGQKRAGASQSRSEGYRLAGTSFVAIFTRRRVCADWGLIRSVVGAFVGYAEPAGILAPNYRWIVLFTWGFTGVWI